MNLLYFIIYISSTCILENNNFEVDIYNSLNNKVNYIQERNKQIENINIEFFLINKTKKSNNLINSIINRLPAKVSLLQISHTKFPNDLSTIFKLLRILNNNNKKVLSSRLQFFPNSSNSKKIDIIPDGKNLFIFENCIVKQDLDCYFYQFWDHCLRKIFLTEGNIIILFFIKDEHNSFKKFFDYRSYSDFYISDEYEVKKFFCNRFNVVPEIIHNISFFEFLRCKYIESNNKNLEDKSILPIELPYQSVDDKLYSKYEEIKNPLHYKITDPCNKSTIEFIVNSQKTWLETELSNSMLIYKYPNKKITIKIITADGIITSILDQLELFFTLDPFIIENSILYNRKIRASINSSTTFITIAEFIVDENGDFVNHTDWMENLEISLLQMNILSKNLKMIINSTNYIPNIYRFRYWQFHKEIYPWNKVVKYKCLADFTGFKQMKRKFDKLFKQIRKKYQLEIDDCYFEIYDRLYYKSHYPIYPLKNNSDVDSFYIFKQINLNEETLPDKILKSYFREDHICILKFIKKNRKFLNLIKNCMPFSCKTGNRNFYHMNSNILSYDLINKNDLFKKKNTQKSVKANTNIDKESLLINQKIHFKINGTENFISDYNNDLILNDKFHFFNEKKLLSSNKNIYKGFVAQISLHNLNLSSINHQFPTIEKSFYKKVNKGFKLSIENKFTNNNYFIYIKESEHKLSIKNFNNKNFIKDFLNCYLNLGNEHYIDYFKLYKVFQTKTFKNYIQEYEIFNKKYTQNEILSTKDNNIFYLNLELKDERYKKINNDDLLNFLNLHRDIDFKIIFENIKNESSDKIKNICLFFDKLIKKSAILIYKLIKDDVLFFEDCITDIIVNKICNHKNFNILNQISDNSSKLFIELQDNFKESDSKSSLQSNNDYRNVFSGTYKDKKNTLIENLGNILITKETLQNLILAYEKVVNIKLNDYLKDKVYFELHLVEEENPVISELKEIKEMLDKFVSEFVILSG